jgi:hypothetical protein
VRTAADASPAKRSGAKISLARSRSRLAEIIPEPTTVALTTTILDARGDDRNDPGSGSWRAAGNRRREGRARGDHACGDDRKCFGGGRNSADLLAERFNRFNCCSDNSSVQTSCKRHGSRPCLSLPERHVNLLWNQTLAVGCHSLPSRAAGSNPGGPTGPSNDHFCRSRRTLNLGLGPRAAV